MMTNKISHFRSIIAIKIILFLADYIIVDDVRIEMSLINKLRRKLLKFLRNISGQVANVRSQLDRVCSKHQIFLYFNKKRRPKNSIKATILVLLLFNS